MCLIVFSWQPEAPYPLVLTANRDEFYQRPTEPVHFWQDQPDILGGKDLEAGGTWMAFSCTGRFAAVTNYREIPFVSGQFSRGRLVSDFLSGNKSASDYLTAIQAQTEKNGGTWSGFNLLAGDSHGLYYYSNRSDSVQSLSPGLYGLSNHLLDTPWPKVRKVKDGLAALLDDNNYTSPQSLTTLMSDSSRYPDQDLPDTGLTQEHERQLSSCFIAIPGYGTRNTSAIVLEKNGSLHWHEQLYGPEGPTRTLEFTMPFAVNWKANTQKTSTL